MITSFKIFEKIITSNIKNNGMTEEMLEDLKDALTITVYKGKKRNNQYNYKVIKIKDINIDFNKRDVNRELLNYTSIIKIEMTNGDKIDSTYIKINKFDEAVDNNIEIKVNDETIYHISDKNFNEKSFINMISTQYKKYIQEKWKIK